MTVENELDAWMLTRGFTLSKVRQMPDAGRRVMFALNGQRNLEAAIDAPSWAAGMPSITLILDGVIASQSTKGGSHGLH